MKERVIHVDDPPPRGSGLSDEQALRMYETMVLARAFDDRTSILVRQGKIPFTVAGHGHEGAQVGAAMTLTPGRDWVLPYYRDVGVVLMLGMTVQELMLGEFGKAGDPNSGGRQMPKHWGCRRLQDRLPIEPRRNPDSPRLRPRVGDAAASGGGARLGLLRRRRRQQGRLSRGAQLRGYPQAAGHLLL